jgi:hypothetical protein
MKIKRKSGLLWSVSCLILFLTATWYLPAQQAPTPAEKDHAQTPSDPLAEMTPENHALFYAFREAIKKENLGDALDNGRKLLPALRPGTELANIVTKLTAQAALETGDTSYALTLIKPMEEFPRTDWVAAEILARLYAESENKELRDRQIAHLLDLHSHTSDKQIAEQQTFTIQTVNLHSGYAIFLYPFKPPEPKSTYLIAEIWTGEGKYAYRIVVGSEPEDQLFFKAKHPGERRFSFDLFRKNEKHPNGRESRKLLGYVEGVFDYDYMRDCVVNIANGDTLPQR